MNAQFSQADVSAAVQAQLAVGGNWSYHLLGDELQVPTLDGDIYTSVKAVLSDRHLEMIDYVDHTLPKIFEGVKANKPVPVKKCYAVAGGMSHWLPTCNCRFSID